MNLLQSHWEKEKCPLLTGIMFPEGVVDLVKPQDQPRKSGISKLVSLERRLLSETANPHLAALNPLFTLNDSARNLTVVCGEGGMGADGFVAVTDLQSGALKRIAFFDFSNPFVKAESIGETIIATNNLDERWRFIPSSNRKVAVGIYAPRS